MRLEDYVAIQRQDPEYRRAERRLAPRLWLNNRWLSVTIWARRLMGSDFGGAPPLTESLGPTEASVAGPIVTSDDMIVVQPEDATNPRTVQHRTWGGRGVVGRLMGK